MRCWEFPFWKIERFEDRITPGTMFLQHKKHGGLSCADPFKSLSRAESIFINAIQQILPIKAVELIVAQSEHSILELRKIMRNWNYFLDVNWNLAFPWSYMGFQKADHIQLTRYFTNVVFGALVCTMRNSPSPTCWTERTVPLKRFETICRLLRACNFKATTHNPHRSG